MILYGDYHTHTTFSHGKDSILDNALSAKDKGLNQLGISDHGFSHMAFGIKKSQLDLMKKLCDEATKETGVKTFLGVEANFTGTDGSVDLKPKFYDKFDIFFAGLHKFILYKFTSNFTLALPDLFYSTIKKKDVPKGLIKENTKTYINVIKNNPIDAITHLNFCCFADAKEVAKACADYGTYVELNAKKTHLSDDEIEAVLSTNAKFIISSDAHSKDRVGEISLVESLIKRTGFPLDRIDNICGRTPDFRFRKFKEGK